MKLPAWYNLSVFAFLYLFVFQIFVLFFSSSIPASMQLILSGFLNTTGFFLLSIIAIVSYGKISRDHLVVVGMCALLIVMIFLWSFEKGLGRRVIFSYLESVMSILIYASAGFFMFANKHLANKSIALIKVILMPLTLTLLFAMVITGQLGSIIGLGSVENSVSYLSISDLFLFFSSFAVLSFYKERKWFKLFFIILFQAALYSRTSFLALLCAIAMYFFWRVLWNRKLLSYGVLIAAFVLGVFVLFYPQIQESLGAFRHTAWLFDRTLATSIYSRVDIMGFGLVSVQQFPFTGNLAWQLDDLYSLGKYIHNGLSYWAQFGLVVFSVVLFFICKSLFAVLFHSDHKLRYFSIVFFAFLVEFIISRAYVYPYFWFVIGLILSLVNIQTSEFKNENL